MENSENPKRCGWSIVRKAQIVGTLIGLVFTIALAITPAGGHQGYPDFAGFLMILFLMPTCIIFHKDLHWFSNDYTGGILTQPLCLAVITNAILGFLIGTFFGWLIQKLKRKN
jgi:hypothetical protein